MMSIIIMSSIKSRILGQHGTSFLKNGKISNSFEKLQAHFVKKAKNNAIKKLTNYYKLKHTTDKTLYGQKNLQLMDLCIISP